MLLLVPRKKCTGAACDTYDRYQVILNAIKRCISRVSSFPIDCLVPIDFVHSFFNPTHSFMKHWSLIFVATIAAIITSSNHAAIAVSPPIEPLSWDDAYAKAEKLVKQMSLEQIASITKGSGLFTGQCVGNAGGTTQPDFPSLCLADGPLGVRGSPFSSAFAAGITAAASFDKDAIRQRGIDMGAEFRGKGANVQLGPSMNIARNARAGRNWEAFGEVCIIEKLSGMYIYTLCQDPYLSGVAAAETIHGIQSQGVVRIESIE